MKSLKKLFIIVDSYSGTTDYFTDFIDENEKSLKTKCNKLNKDFEPFINTGSNSYKYQILPFSKAIENFEEKVAELNTPDYPY